MQFGRPLISMTELELSPASGVTPVGAISRERIRPQLAQGPENQHIVRLAKDLVFPAMALQSRTRRCSVRSWPSSN